MFINRYRPMGGGVEMIVILVRHNLSIIPPVEHNFEHNTLVSRVTPESIILYFFEHNPADPILLLVRNLKMSVEWLSR